MAQHPDPDERFTAEVGRRLRERRLDRGMTLDELSAASDVTKAMIAYVENGERDIGIGKLHRICRALRCTLGQFFDRLPSKQERAA